MSRLFFASAIVALLPALSAQVFYAEPSGYTRQEISLGDIPGGFVTFLGGATFDADGNFYFWDGTSIRRLADGAPPLFTLPQAGAFGIYPDDIEFDPANPDDLFIVDSSEPGLYKLTRDGLDAVAATPSYVAYPFPNARYLYDLAFDPVSGELIACGADGFGVPPSLFLIDRTTLAAVKIADVTSVGNGSGPVAFDAQGNLFAAIPAPFGSNGPVDIVRFPAARIAAAIAGNGALVLDGENVADASLFVVQADGFMSPTRMQFRTEGGKEILYFTGADEGTLYVSDIYDVGGPVATVFAAGTGPTHDPINNAFNGAGALAVESRTADFAPDGNGRTRVIAVNGFYLASHNFDFALHAANVFRPKPAVGGYVAAAGLRVVTQPAGVEQGAGFGLTVEILDENGLRVTSGSDAALPVTIAKSTGAGALSGTLTVNAVAGLATFTNVIADTTGTLRLAASAPGAFGAASLPITVFANSRVLSFALQPVAVLANAAFSVRGEIRDGNGTLVSVGPSATAMVTVSIASGGGTLSGVTTLAAIGGIVQFNNLSLDVTDDVTLQLEATGMTTAASQSITVLAVDPGTGGGGGGGSCTAASTVPLSALVPILPLLIGTIRRRRVSNR
ncbi:MAG: hypothetical protein IT462_17520 [Planctomycetes bacterium]|nr:hypothetical protein [Planctomycetota bacterium]